MKICYIVGHYPPHIGGVEILFMNYAQGMKAAGHEVRVVTSSSGGVSGKLLQNGIEMYYCDWKILFGHPIPKRKDMEKHVEWADIVHTTTFTVANPARKLCEKHKTLSVITIHEVLGDKWYWVESNKIKAFAFRMFEKYVCCKPYDYIHVISDATLSDYERYYGRRDNMVKIYNSVDHEILKLSGQSPLNFSEYFALPDGVKSFLYFGRPGQSKGIFVYLNAICLLKEKYGEEFLEDYKFCFILSDDPIAQKKQFIKLVEKNNLNKYITIKQSMKRTDLFCIISQADYVVIPSITEGFGFTAAESCLLGKKVIHSDGGALPEVVSGKVLPFKNRNSADLAEKLALVIKKGDEAFCEVPFKDFKKEDMIREFINFYKKMMGEEK